MQHSRTSRLWDERDTLYQLTDPDVMANPYPFFARLQELGPIYFDESLHAYICTAFAEGKRILQEGTNFGAGRLRAPDRRITDVLDQQMLVQDGDSLSHKHTRIAMQPRFRPLSYQRLRESFYDVARTLLLEVREKGQGHFDVVREYAALLPTRISAELLGLPVEPLLDYMRWNEAYELLLGLPLPEHELQQHVVPPLHEALNVLSSHVASRRRVVQREQASEPQSLLDALLLSPYEQACVTDDYLVAQAMVLLAGGYKTATHLTVMTLYWLQVVGQLSLVKKDAAHIAHAVRECMSYDGSSLLLARKVKRKITLADVALTEGDTVFVLLPAANRDLREQQGLSGFDCLNPTLKHLGFGAGGHLCPGGPLAEFYASIAIEVLLAIFPDILVDTTSLLWGTLTSVRCVEQMRASISLPHASDRSLVQTKGKLL